MSLSLRNRPSRRRPRRRVLLNLLSLWLWMGSTSPFSVVRAAEPSTAGAVSVLDYLPAGYVTDGSACYQSELQRALDAAAESGQAVVFPPLTYRLEDPAGLRVHSGQVLHLRGAKFVFSDALAADGQAFRGENVSAVEFHGGEIVGRNDVWPAGVNIRGLHFTGACAHIRIAGMTLRDLSSNGIGLFGGGLDQPIRDVWVLDCVFDHCCNVYGDYQAPPPQLRGPEPGSTREDQGAVAFYYVNDWVVRGCRFDHSRSDGTHFYRCKNGQFSDNRVYRSRMGGYFLETCEHVLAVNNIIRDNGSRGVTIERGSRACTLIGNTVEGSGREGLWMPDSAHCVAMHNLFLRNGRKPNGSQPHQVWNANVTINESRGDPSDSPAVDCVVAQNLFDTAADQVAAIRVVAEETVRGIVIEGNILTGDNRRIVVDGDFPQQVRVAGNIGQTPP